MYEEFVEHINGLIYYGFFYKQDGSYIDDIMESLKVEIEKKINKQIDWEEIDYQRLESDVCTQHYDSYYTEKELFNILKTIKLNSSNIEDITISLDYCSKLRFHSDYRRAIPSGRQPFYATAGRDVNIVILKNISRLQFDSRCWIQQF